MRPHRDKLGDKILCDIVFLQCTHFAVNCKTLNPTGFRLSVTLCDIKRETTYSIANFLENVSVKNFQVVNIW